jgi:O-methyltransferase
MTRRSDMNRMKAALVHIKEWCYTIGEAHFGVGRRHFGANITGLEGDFLVSALERVREVPGDIIECGAFRGGSTLTMCRAMTRLNLVKHVFAVDTFAGMPRPGKQDLSPDGRSFYEGGFAYNSKTLVAGRMLLAGYRARVTLVPGLFETALQQIPAEKRFCLCFIDCDFYEGAAYCLQQLYPRLNPGGYLCIHDYKTTEAPGIARAVEEFFCDKPERIKAAHHIAYVIKE